MNTDDMTMNEWVCRILHRRHHKAVTKHGRNHGYTCRCSKCDQLVWRNNNLRKKQRGVLS